MSPIILGIDPGSRITGWGVIRCDPGKIQHINNGIIAPREKELGNRLHQIYTELGALIAKYQPERAAIEEVFLAHNVKSALLLGHARGAAMLALAHAGVPFQEYAAREVKMAVTGFGAASKEQIQRMTMTLLQLPEIATADAADALSVALCHAHSLRMEKMLRRQAKPPRMGT